MKNIQHYNQLISYQQENEVSKNIKYKLSGIIRVFIKSALAGDVLTPSGNRYKKGSMRRYKTLILWIERYENEFSETVFLETVNPYWAELFTNFLTKQQLTKNSVGCNLAALKAIIRRAFLAGLTDYTGFGIKSFHEYAPAVYFSISELKQFFNHNFDTETKNRVRDIFVMHCFLGFRVSDYKKFLANPLRYLKTMDNRYFLQYISEKTNTETVVPIGYIVRKILLRHNFYFKGGFSTQFYNKYLKMLAYDAGISQKIIYTKTIGGEKQEFIKEKWEMVSSHTARRTFATLADMNDIPRGNIMRMTGHSTETSFLKYVRHSNIENAVKIQNHDFFNLKL